MRKLHPLLFVGHPFAERALFTEFVLSVQSLNTLEAGA